MGREAEAWLRTVAPRKSFVEIVNTWWDLSNVHEKNQSNMLQHNKLKQQKKVNFRSYSPFKNIFIQCIITRALALH